MEEKIFKAETMMEALEKVQSEMGPEAVVVSVREIQSPAWSLHKKTLIEVKAAPAGTAARPKAPAASTAPAAPAREKTAPALVDDAGGIEWLGEDEPAVPAPPKKQPRPAVSSIPAVAPRPGVLPVWPEPAPTVPAVPFQKLAPAAPGQVKTADLPASLLSFKQQLAAQEVDPAFLDRIIDLALESLSPLALKNEELIQKYLSRLLEAELRAAPPRDLKPPAPVVCLVGTSGSGKTSLAGRLSMLFGPRLDQKVTWICADVIRTGAIAEARTYTDALGIPLVVVYTPAELKQALSQAAGSDLILIDMPGYNPLDEYQVAELGTFLTEIPNRSLLLVASASQKEKDLFQAAASFGIFGLTGLVVTKMDETSTFGAIYNLVQKSQIPLVYFSTGRGSAGSLEPASAGRLVSALFSHGAF